MIKILEFKIFQSVPSDAYYSDVLNFKFQLVGDVWTVWCSGWNQPTTTPHPLHIHATDVILNDIIIIFNCY